MQLGLNSYLALLPNGTNRNGGIGHPASPVPVQRFNSPPTGKASCDEGKG